LRKKVRCNSVDRWESRFSPRVIFCFFTCATLYFIKYTKMSPVKKSSQIHYPFEQLKQERVNWINKYSPRTKSCCGCLLLLIIFGCVSVLLIWEYMWKTHTTYDIYRCSGAPTPLPTLNPNSFNGTLLAESFGTVYSWTPY
jgi:hypothetical protein